MKSDIIEIVNIIFEHILNYSTNNNRENIFEYLLQKGYNVDDINDALAILYSLTKNGVKKQAGIKYKQSKLPRILNNEEIIKIRPEAYSFLLKQYLVGFINDEQFEEILTTSAVVDVDEVNVEEMKKIIDVVVMGEINQFYDYNEKIDQRDEAWFR